MLGAASAAAAGRRSTRQPQPTPDRRAATFKTSLALAQQSRRGNHANAAMPDSHLDCRWLSIEIAALHRIEFTILAGDQIIGKREARHRLEASRPSFQVGPVGDLKPALRHEHHAAPAADIGNRAIIAD
jgi:hypothetical protein